MLLYFINVFVCMYVVTYMTQCACGGQSITWGLCSPFPVCESPGGTQSSFRFGTKHLYILNHLSGPAKYSLYLKATVLRREDLSMSTTSLIQRWALSSSTSVFLVISRLHRHSHNHKTLGVCIVSVSSHVLFKIQGTFSSTSTFI